MNSTIEQKNQLKYYRFFLSSNHRFLFVPSEFFALLIICFFSFPPSPCQLYLFFFLLLNSSLCSTLAVFDTSLLVFFDVCRFSIKNTVPLLKGDTFRLPLAAMWCFSKCLVMYAGTGSYLELCNLSIFSVFLH